MSTDLVLQRAGKGADIDRQSVARALAEISATGELTCCLSIDQLAIHIGLLLPPTDSRSAGISVSFSDDGSELVGSTRSRSSESEFVSALAQYHQR